MRRIQVLLAALVLVCFAAPLAAQNARATGVVRDTSGRAIRGATIRALNPEASPSEITSTTNNRGQWAMIGLRIGTWRFIAEAPGYAPIEAAMPVRVSSSPPVVFTLERDPGTLPGALDRNIIQQTHQAAVLREEGRLDQALAAYGDIRAKNPQLTSVNLVIGDLYRAKASGETDPAARRASLEQAIGAYTRVLATDSTNEQARRELEETRGEMAAIP